MKTVLSFSFITIVLLGHLFVPTTGAQGQRGVGLNTLPAGNYHALVIGNNAYQKIRPLQTAETDAREVETLLKTQYGFETKLLLNGTRQQIVSALYSYRRILDANSNLLIYYAGHGINDKEAGKAYWLPADAELDDNANWISADDITTNIKVIPAKHVLIVSDSCYSGTLTRGLGELLPRPTEREQFLGKMAQGRSRTLMASGGNEPVADGGGGKHSVFAAALLRGLREMDKEQFTAAELFRYHVEESVAGRANQTPEYTPLRNSGHESGDFIFIRIKTEGKSVEVTIKAPTSPAGTGVDPAAIELSFWESIKGSTDVEDFKAYLEAYPTGRFVPLARNNMRRWEAATKAAAPASNSAANTSAPTTDAARPVGRPQQMVNRTGVEMVWIPAGSFIMGSESGDADEQPVHRVTVSEGFYMGKHEVTQGQWQKLLGNNPSKFKGCDSCPVEQVSWNDVQFFIQKLNQQNDGYTYRLPTEAEWEYACRAGTTGDHAGYLDSMAWYVENSGSKIHPVGEKQPNAFGLFDMHGNVWEWCQDWHHDSYDGAPTDCSAWLSGGKQNERVLRGGSYLGIANSLRSAERAGRAPGARSDLFGFRVVASARSS
jgi:formylglycine-generating enzyme required for sulfatase activity/uncharacterized caspase-like protein